MTFVDDNGSELNIAGSFAMTKQAVSFFNGSIKGDVSTTFTVDNNSVNRETLGYSGPQMVTQVAWTKQAFNRVRNGNILDRGYIVIQSDNGDSLSCFYVSGNSNWVQLLNGLITELDYSGVTNGRDYTTQLSITGVTNTITNTSGVIFPFVDWICNYNKGDNKYWMAGSSEMFDTPDVGIDLFPCFYLHSLVSEILSQSGLKISGSILDDPIYNSLIITPVSAIFKRSNFFSLYLYGSNQSVTTLEKYTAITSPGEFFVNGDYTAQSTQRVFVKVSRITGTANTSIYVNGVSYLDLVTPPPGPGQGIYDVFYPIQLNRNDTLSVYVSGFVGSVRYNISIRLQEIIKINDYVLPSNFLPKLKNIEIVKFVINYFGCANYFNEYSKTITCNIIEKIKTEDALDWSEYYISHNAEYTVNQAKNNYIRLATTSNDLKLTAYNNAHELNFGEGNIETSNTLKYENEIIKIPFSASYADIATNEIYMTSIPLVNLVDDANSITFTSITDLGSGFSRFNGVSQTSQPNKVFRLSDGLNDLGYFLISSVTSTTITAYYTYSSTFAGTIWIQNINYNTITPRILSVKVNTNVSDISPLSSISVISGGTTLTSIPYATFTKQVISDGIDQWKNNLAIDNPDGGGFTDPTIKELYFNKISRFFQNPTIKARFILPEAVYQRFEFDQFIYLKTERLTGYFFVDSIVNYVDGNTPVEVRLYML